MPLVEGRTPVMTARRDGWHEGEAQCALANNVPRASNRSMFGARIPVRPPITQSLRSSMAMKRMLGLAAGAAEPPITPHARSIVRTQSARYGEKAIIGV